ncbi:hypothetical protein UPYG_G00336730 [Umbra pygmaea]|uniref:Uncharacterized protein n=1 Tax=Umbra pygmaea TaxID=75934 RepID=A0ABD0VWE9_UMBPY
MEQMGGGKKTKSHPPDLHSRGRFPVSSGVPHVYYTTQLCERLIQPRSDFDLTDPNGFLLNSEYNNLHDPNLRYYFHRKDIHQRLLDLGLITNDDKVTCSLKELHCYRNYLEEVELCWSRRFLTEQKQLLRTFLTRQQQGQIPDNLTLSDVTEWLLARGSSLFSQMKQAARARRFPAKNEVEEEFSLSRLPKITKKYSLGNLNCCPCSTCSSKMIWNAKGHALLQEVIKEVKREIRLERYTHTKKEQKEKMKQKRQQKRLCLKGQKMEMHSPTRTGQQNSPETLKNLVESVSDSDNTLDDLVDFTKTRLSTHQISPYPEQKHERLSAMCQNQVEYVKPKSAISAHNICTDSPGLVDTISFSLVTGGSQFGQFGNLTQLSEIKQRKTEEDFEGTITTEELQAFTQSVVMPGLKEVNRVLTPSIVTSDHDRLKDSSLESAGTCLKCQVTRTESSNEGTVLTVKVESVIREEMKGAVDKLEAEEDRRVVLTLTNMTLDVKAKMDSNGAGDSAENANTDMGKHNPGSHEPSQSLSADDGGYLTLPSISMLNSTTLSSDLVDEILDKVINILLREGLCITSSPDVNTNGCSVTRGFTPRCEPLCCVSNGQDPEFYIQNLEQDLSDTPPKLLEGQASILNSFSPQLLNKNKLSKDIMPYNQHYHGEYGQ